jgi:hypothetical protein
MRGIATWRYLEAKRATPDIKVEMEPFLLNPGVDQQMDKAKTILTDGRKPSQA